MPLQEQQLAGCERSMGRALPHVSRDTYTQGAQPTAHTFATMIDHILQTPLEGSDSSHADSFVQKLGSRAWYAREVVDTGRDQWRLTDILERAWELVRGLTGLTDCCGCVCAAL